MTTIVISSVYSNYATNPHVLSFSSYVVRVNNPTKRQREIDIKNLDLVENSIREYLSTTKSTPLEIKRTKYTLIVSFNHISQIDMVNLGSIYIPKELRLEIY